MDTDAYATANRLAGFYWWRDPSSIAPALGDSHYVVATLHFRVSDNHPGEQWQAYLVRGSKNISDWTSRERAVAAVEKYVAENLH